jgi:GT2 family glycosyltransferase
MSHDVVLLVTTRNRRDELLATLERTVPAQFPADAVTVWDDGSDDGTAEAVRERFPEVELLARETGGGYMAARNHLLDRAAAAGSDIAVSLDDDAHLVSPEDGASVRALLEDAFTRHPRAAVLAFRIFWDRQPPPPGAADVWSPDDSDRRVDGFVGCGHAWRLDAWRELSAATGGYPTWFRTYGEEAWATRWLFAHGWEVRYLPEVLVHHRVTPSERPAAERAERGRLQLRSGLFTLLLTAPATRIPRLLGHVMKSQLSRHRSLRTVGDLARVGGSVIRHLPRMVAERRAMSEDAWRRWLRLDPAEIYWRPKSPDSGFTK